MTQAGTTEPQEKKANPIVSYLALPSEAGEKPYLKGTRCQACGATYVGKRMACSRCFETQRLQEVRLSDKGHVWVWSIVHASFPGIQTPYVAAVVDLENGGSVNCNLVDVEPDPAKLKFGMPVEMVTRTVATDREGNDVVAFFFRPAKDGA